MFGIIENVLRPHSGIAGSEGILKLHREALRSREEIMKVDFGTGRMGESAVGSEVRRNRTESQHGRDRQSANDSEIVASEYPIRVKQLAGRSTLPLRRAQQLHRLAKFTGAEQILELGTSLGFTTAWLALALPTGGKIISLEGCPETLKLAERNIRRLGLEDRITLMRGRFEETLSQALEQMPRPDMVFIDGNHRREPTLNYFTQCLDKAHERTIIVIDDIHHSAEMEAAWEEIKAHSAVRVSIDLFRMGLIFLREGLSTQHFILRY